MLLIIVVFAVHLALRLRGRPAAEAACLGLAAGMLLSGADHLLRRQWYAALVASWPAPLLLVQLSAAARIAVGLLLLRPGRWRRRALAAALLLMLIVLPVNLGAAVGGGRLPAGDEMSAAWRWLRAALHLVWLAWIAGCLWGAESAPAADQ